MVYSYRYNPTPIVERPKPSAESPPDPNTLELRAAALFKILEDCAEDGKLCPTANQIADIFGFASTASTHRLMERLIDNGLIEVESFNCGRIVTIVATGKKTARPKHTGEHWRRRRNR